MDKVPEQPASQETDSILNTDRKLIPIDDYAAREGVSKDIVEQCGRLGIVQIRRHKGKVYVVDVPLGPYFFTPDGTIEAPEQKAPPDNISNEKHQAEIIQTPELEDFETGDGLPDCASATDDAQVAEFGEIFQDELLKTDSEPVEIIQNDEIQFSFSDEAPYSESFSNEKLDSIKKSQRIWQLITAIVTMFLCITLFYNLLLRGDKQVHRDMLNRANEHIKRALDNSAVVSKKNEAIRAQLAQLNTQLSNSQKQLQDARAEVERLRGELSRTRQYLQAIKEQNSEAIERLNKQIKILTE